MAPTPETALVAAFAAGDRAAGEALFTRHLGAVRAFLVIRCRDTELAEELTQEVAARVSLTAVRLDPDGNVAGYLVRVAQNIWRDWLRHELVRRRAEASLESAGPGAAPPADAAVLARDLQAALHRAIAALPVAQRAVVELRHRDNLTFQQIADRLGRPLGTVLTQMRAALARMHDAMKEYR